ncbi:MAG: hypothetical protein HY554_13625, partial [Elusimicrobia bacterium]|nr:hypothetical protein [Elusimicrobiota bacterium]
MSAISGTASDDQGVSEVRVSIRRNRDGLFWNGSAYASGEAFLLATGANTWSLNTDAAVNDIAVGTGTFTITARARDTTGALQTSFEAGVSQIMVTRQPNLPINVAASFVASSSMTIAWEHNGNPPNQQYHLHYQTAAHCGDISSFFGTEYLAGTSQVLSSLQSNSTYFFEVHVLNGQTTRRFLVTTLSPGQSTTNVPLVDCGGGGSGSGGGFGGLAIAKDASDNIWEVVSQNSQFRLSKFGSNGVFISSTPLPGATDNGDWSIAFKGDVFAVGSSSGSTGADVAVYRVTSGGELVASRFHNNPTYNSNDYALGSGAGLGNEVWISGAIQTSGPIDHETPGTRTYALGIWRYDVAGNTLELAATQSQGANADAGFGLAVHPGGSAGNQDLWVVGFSSNTATPGINKLDLALWKFNYNGTTVGLSGGPFRRPGYAHETDRDGEDFSAKLALGAGSIYIAASRRNDLNNNDLAYVKYDLAGTLQAEKAWFANAPAGREEIRGVALDASENLLIAGRVPGLGGDRLALWNYAPTGALQSADTLPPLREARGVALVLGNTWLAANTTYPILVQGNVPIPGLEGQEGTGSASAESATFLGDFNQPGGALYDGGDKDGGSGTSIARDGASGDVYTVAITSRGVNDNDWVVLRYDAAGIKLASTTVNSGAGLGDGVHDVLVDGEDLYVAGDSPYGQRRVYRFDRRSLAVQAYAGGGFGTYIGLLRLGESLFASYADGTALRVEKLRADTLAATGVSYSFPTSGPTRVYDGNALKRNLATDGSSIFAVGLSTSTGELLLVKLSSVTLAGGTPVVQSGPAYRYGASIAYNPFNARLYATAVSASPTDVTRVFAFDTAPAYQSDVSFVTDFVASGQQIAVRAIGVDPDNGDVYVAGNNGQPGVRYTAALAQVAVAGNLGGVRSLAVNNTAEVFMAGGANAGNDVATRRVNFATLSNEVGIGYTGVAFVPGSNAMWASSPKAGVARKFVSPASPVTDLTAAASTRTVPSSPLGLGFDTGGNLWVSRSTSPARFDNSQLVRFANNGSDVASATSAALSAGLRDVSGAAFQPDTGDLWVSNGQGAESVAGAASILKFLRTGTLSAPTFSDVNATTFAFVSQGSANGLAFDRANNLWAAFNVDGKVRMYPNSGGVVSSTPALVISAIAKPFAIAVNSSGTVFVASVDVDGGEPGNGKLYRLNNFGTPASPSIDPNPVLVQTGIDLAGLAFDLQGRLWGADFTASQVLTLSTAALTARQEFAVIRGTLTYAGSRPGNFQVLVTTNPVNPGQGSTYLFVGPSAGEYVAASLPVPNTYYVFAFKSGDFEPRGFDPLGVYITEPAPRAPAPIFITAASTRSSVDVQLLDLSAATGTITNLSSQLGNLRVQAWYGDPRAAGSALIDDRYVSPAQSAATYAVYVQTTTLLFTRAYLDANFNGRSEPGEDAGVSVGPLTTVAGSSIPVNITISSSAAGSVFVQTTSLAPAAAGSNVTDLPMLRLGLWSAGGSAQMNRLRLSLAGDSPSSYVHARVWKDANGDGALQTGLDYVLNGQSFDTGAPPKAELPFFSTQTISGTTQYFFVTVSYFGVSAGRKLGVFVERAEDLGLVSGSPSAGFPLASAETAVKFTLQAKPQDGFYPVPSGGSFPTGGAYTGLFVNSGQNVLIAAQGSWSPGGVSVGPAGGAATGGLGAGLKLGALVGRVGNGPWFYVGVSSSFVAAQGGDLYLAMNDTFYDDNAGAIPVDFSIVVSTVAKTWTGNSGISLNASLDNNWLGGKKPAPGEPISFDGAVSTKDCNWDLAYFEVGPFAMTSSYAGMVTIGDPGPGQFYNQITFSSHVRVAGGTLNLGDNTDATVKGELRVEGGTFDMGPRLSYLRLSRQGVLVRAGGRFKSEGAEFVSLQALNSFDGFPFRVQNGTVSFSNAGNTEFSNTTGVDLHASAYVAAFRGVRFFNYNLNPAPSLVLHGSANRTFQGVEFDAFVSTNVDASDASGAAIAMLDATGAHMGSPYERDPLQVVTWSPDGGGAASLAGVLSTDGSGSGAFRLIASTRPAPPSGGDFCSSATSGATCVRISTPAAGAYSISGLLAPNTWYVFAFRDANEFAPAPFAPRGGYGNPGLLRSSPIFLANASAPSSIDVSISSWGAVQGQVSNLSSQQAGGIRVALTQLSDTATYRTSERQFMGPAGGFYYLPAPAGNAQVFAWVDVNNNGVADDFEASGTAATGALSPGQTATVNVDIAGGAVVAGATLTVRPSVVHPGFVGDSGNSPIFKLVASAIGSGDVTWNALRLDRTAAPYQLRATLWKDQGTIGAFEDGGMTGPSGGDLQLGDTWISPQASSGTIQFWSPQILSSGQSATYFISVEVNDGFYQQGRSPQRVPVQLSIGTSVYFSLTQGRMADEAISPSDSGAASVYFALMAFTGAEAPSNGGYDTGVFVDAGQKVILNIATGTWTPVPYGATTPAGLANTEGQSAVVPSARIGALIARVGGSPWVAVGTQAAISAQFPGSVSFAMNDLNRDHFNNTGRVYFDFAVSGSTAGALTGQIQYTGAETNPNVLVVQLRERFPNCFGQFCTGPVVRSTTVGLAGGTTAYFYTFPQLRPLEYTVDAYVNSRPDQTGGFQEAARVLVGSTVTAPTFALSLGTASVSGTITYAGVQQYGNFSIAAATTSNLERGVVFFGNVSQPAAGAYALANLPIPNTYYIVGFRDVNANREPDGPEPFGIVGVSTGPLSQLASLFSPVFVDSNKTGINITMVDRGAISGQLHFETAVATTTEIVIEAGLGLRGSPGYVPESRDVKRLFVPKAAGEAEFYQASLVRPATGYSVFAFLDANRNGNHESGELFGSASNLSVPSGGFANVDLLIAAAKPPPAPGNLRVEAVSTTQLRWTWDAAPGATNYFLISASADGS